MVEAVLQIDGQTSRLLWESNQRKIKGVLIQWKRSVVLFSTTGDQVIESQCINTVQREQTGGVGGKEIANPMNTTILFLQQFSKELKLIFTRLSDSKLLKRCVKGHSQNANESPHHVIWHCWPKERFVGRNTVETAIALAVASFNVGAKSVDPLLQSIGLGEDHTLQALVRKDKLCLYHAAYKDSELHEQENVRDMQKRVERKP